jgi:hypothetical protein
MTLDELLVALGFEYDPEELESFKEDIDSTVSSLKSLIKMTAATVGALTGLAVATTRATDEQGKLAEEIGESVEIIDALQHANQSAGQSTDEMSNSLRSLAVRAAEASRGIGSGLEAFGILGINVEDANGNLKTSSGLLFEVSERFETLDKFQQIELAEKLGLSGSIRLLQQGPQAIQELIREAKELGVATKEDARLSAEFQDSLLRLWRIVKQGARLITTQLVPILGNLADKVEGWWKNNREIIEQKFPQWVSGLIKILKILSVVLGIGLIGRIGTLVVGLARTIIAFRSAAAAAALFSGAVALLPALIAIGIALLVGLIEDAQVFFRDGDSLIGDLINKFPEWEGAIRIIASLFKGIADTTRLIFDGWSRIFNLFSGFSFSGIKDFFSSIPTIGVPGFDGTLGELVERREEIFNANINRNVMPEIAGAGAGGTSRSFRIDNMNISVPGTGDPFKVADEVFRRFEQASEDLSSPVDQ